MGRNNSKSVSIGVATYSPIDFDIFIDKELKRTTNPKDKADVLYSKTPVDTDIPIQVIFNDYDFLKSWDLKVGDYENGKRLRLTNERVDELIKGV